MAEEIKVSVHADHTMKCEYNTKTLHRIRRIQGQLAGLERMIEADDGTCEERVIRARAIEKGMTSLITHLVECYLVNTARYEMESDPEKTTQDLARIFDLLNH
ncbi:MAG: metal-sensitive transcriptional regulator [Anaerolineaceae bacterium]|nr:metal-sensitive transcriptional regulator [Anaerolineaceae bacterium]